LKAVLVSIEEINGSPGPSGGGQLASGWRYPTNFNTLSGYPTTGYSEKRLLNPPGIINAKPTFVEVHGVALQGGDTEDYSTCYNPLNFLGNTCVPTGPGNDFLPSGRGFPPNPDPAAPSPSMFGDTTATLYNPAITGGDPGPGVHRVHVEIDRNWSAYAVDTGDSTWDGLNGHITFRNLSSNVLIDAQGFVYWDPEHLTEAAHNFSGWEIHPVTAFRVHQ
jgi:hypothetical protein